MLSAVPTAGHVQDVEHGIVASRRFLWDKFLWLSGFVVLILFAAVHCTWYNYNRDLQYVDVVCRGCFDLLWVRLLGLIGPPAVARNFVRAQ